MVLVVFDLRINTMPRHSCGRKVAMMVGLCLYSVVVGLLRHLPIATTQLSELDGASTDAQSPSVTLLLHGCVWGGVRFKV